MHLIIRLFILYSQEPLHLTNRHCYKYNTLIHKNVIGIESAKDKNGFVVVQRKKGKIVSISSNFSHIDVLFMMNYSTQLA